MVASSPPLVDRPLIAQGQLRKPFRVLAIGLAGTLLVGGWVFLFVKARDVDLPVQNEIIGLLRTLKNIDNRWNDRLQGARLADAKQASATDAPVTPVALAITLHRLAVQAQTRVNPTLNQSITALKDAFAEKTTSVDRFWSSHVALHESLNAYNLAAVDPAVRSSLSVARMSAALSNYLIQPTRETMAVAQTVLGELEAAGLAATEVARRAREIVERKSAEEMNFRAVLYTTTGSRIDTLTQAFDREFEGDLLTADLFRVYLLFYSAFLLAALAFLGVRLLATYRVIRGMNEALRDANEGLEHRVEERTRELKHALDQLKESEALLIQSEKMSSLGQMVAGVAHEMNTPLAYVKSSLESVSAQMPRIDELRTEAERLLALLEGEAADEQALADQFARVQALVQTLREEQVVGDLNGLVKDGLHGIGQISELVTNLRNFARLDRGRLSPFDLNEGIDAALVIARNLVKRRTVNREFGALPRVTCSPSLINQVFLNLITNAAQATSEAGGIITLRTAAKDRDHVVIEVEDNGHGIPEQVLPKIFDPFFSTKEVGEGTGLGLSIAYKIVEQHGGRITVASKVGVGTRFTIVLPVVARGDPPAVTMLAEASRSG